jgi:hypothetical protein
MLDVPDRASFATPSKLATRILKKSNDQDTRVLAKAFQRLLGALDEYVADVYPSFDLIEAECRDNGCRIVLDAGVFRLVGRNGDHIVSGPTLRDLFINYLLQNTDWVEQEELQEAANEEDGVEDDDE